MLGRPMRRVRTYASAKSGSPSAEPPSGCRVTCGPLGWCVRLMTCPEANPPAVGDAQPPSSRGMPSGIGAVPVPLWGDLRPQNAILCQREVHGSHHHQIGSDTGCIRYSSKKAIDLLSANTTVPEAKNRFAGTYPFRLFSNRVAPRSTTKVPSLAGATLTTIHAGNGARPCRLINALSLTRSRASALCLASLRISDADLGCGEVFRVVRWVMGSRTSVHGCFGQGGPSSSKYTRLPCSLE